MTTRTRLRGPMSISMTVTVDDALLLGLPIEGEPSRDEVASILKADFEARAETYRTNGNVLLGQRAKEEKAAEIEALRAKLAELEGSEAA